MDRIISIDHLGGWSRDETMKAERLRHRRAADERCERAGLLRRCARAAGAPARLRRGLTRTRAGGRRDARGPRGPARPPALRRRPHEPTGSGPGASGAGRRHRVEKWAITPTDHTEAAAHSSRNSTTTPVAHGLQRLHAGAEGVAQVAVAQRLDHEQADGEADEDADDGDEEHADDAGHRRDRDRPPGHLAAA